MRPVIGFDTETNGTKFDGEVASVQFYFPDVEGVAANLFCPVNMVGMNSKLKSQQLDIIKKVVEKYSLIAHHGMFDIVQLHKLGIDISKIEIAGDSFLYAAMAQIRGKKLKELVVKFGIAKPEEVETFDFVVPHHDSTKIRFDNQQFISYACNDAEWAYLLEEKLHHKYPSLYSTYQEELLNIIPFAKMQIGGMKLDYDGFTKFRTDWKNQNIELKKELNDMAGWDFRSKSRADLMRVLFDEMGLQPSPIRTEKGAISVSAEALEYMKGNPFVDKLMDYTHRFDVESTLATIEKYLPDNFKHDAAYLHPNYKIVGEDGTSRVYTQDPSTNQLPTEFRNFIIAEEGKKFIFGDWKAAELMLAAYWAGEQWLIDAYEQGADLHRLISSKLLDKNIEDITDAEREVSKVVTFSVMYGSEGGAASRALKISFDEANKLVVRFWTLCPAIAALRQNIIGNAQKTGYTKTITGRKRKIALLFSKREADRDKGKRQAFNTAIQGSVADLQKKLIQAVTPILEREMKSRFSTTVFDSFLVESPKEVPNCEIEALLRTASHFDVYGIEVKLQLDVSEGSTFAEATGKGVL